MAAIEFQEGAIQIDAQIIADGLGIEASAVQERLREGKITARYERGTGEDEGRHRLTFFAAHRKFRVIVDEAGKVIRRSIVNFPGDSRSAPAQKPG